MVSLETAETMDQRTLQELQRKAFIYDALTADPGQESIETLTHWRRLVKGTEYSIGCRLTERLDRIDAHIANGGVQ